MAWPQNKQEFIERIDELYKSNEDEMTRPEHKQQNTILINAFRTDLRRLRNNEEYE